MAALGDVHGSELTGPFVDVLKNKAMNYLEVGRVKSAKGGFDRQFDQAALRSRGFEPIENLSIAQVAAIAQDVSPWVEVRVRTFVHAELRSRHPFRRVKIRRQHNAQKSD